MTISSGRTQLFSMQTREDTVSYIRELITNSLPPSSDDLTSYCYVFFDRPETLLRNILSANGVSLKIEHLSDAISFVRFPDGYDKHGRPNQGEQLNTVRGMLHDANIPYLTVTEGHGKYEYPKNFIESTIHYYFGEHSTGSTHFFRQDLNETFRSTWEANIARIFRLVGIPYEYEKQMLPRHDENGNVVGVYIPDFWLSDNRIVEVKGFWDYDSRMKVLEMQKYYPDYRYFAIDQDIYMALSRKYRNSIPNWESGDKDEYISQGQKLPITGIAYGNRRKTLQTLKVGDQIVLCRDPENAFDSNAIIAKSIDGEEIGYLAADWACVYAPKMDLGIEYECHLLGTEQKKAVISAMCANPDMIMSLDFLRG